MDKIEYIPREFIDCGETKRSVAHVNKDLKGFDRLDGREVSLVWSSKHTAYIQEDVK